MSWGAVIGAAASLVGTNMAGNAASSGQGRQRQVFQRLKDTHFDPGSIGTQGGMGVDFTRRGVSGIDTQFNFGSNAQIFDLFGANALADTRQGTNIQGLANLGIPGMLGAMGQSGQLADQAFGRAQELGGGFQRGLQSSLFGGAQQRADRLGQGFDATRDQTLATLREQAAPQEQRAQDQLFERLQSQGILRSTGGARAFESFGLGQGQADLDRQLQSFNVANQQQQGDISALNAFGQQGQGLAGLENSLMQDAFSRFGSTTNLTNDLSNNLFNRGSALRQQGAQGLGGQNALMQMLMSLGSFQANVGAQASNTEIAAAGGQGTSASNFGAGGQDIFAGFLGSLGQNFMQSDSTPFASSSTGQQQPVNTFGGGLQV